MKIKSFLARPYASIVHSKVRKGMATAVADQQAIMQYLIKQGSRTVFGKDHNLSQVKNYEDFKKAVPVRDYEAISPYIDKIKNGEQNVLWKGKPIYFAKTSGTTSGAKYIPISKESIGNHISGARDALLCYMAESGNTSFADGKMIFLSGSPEMERVGGIPTGRLSGIVNHYIPRYLRGNQLPSYETNCIEDWEVKLDKIVKETMSENMTLISGIPPWMQMYFDWLMQRNEGKKITQLFPKLQVIVHGGVNFEPYKARLIDSLGGKIDMIETFPASEGFFAFQDVIGGAGLLLNTASGIFFEFIPAAEIHSDNPKRLSLGEVKVGENYALIVSTNAGLWGYSIGDTVRFVSTDPYRLVVTGRIKHFISAFGEHVIGEEVEYAIMNAAKDHAAQITEFTIAPAIQVSEGLPYHEWFVEFEKQPANIAAFATTVNNYLRGKNIYYEDLISGGILQTLKIRVMKKNTFIEYMKSIGKLGGQNKVPRLGNDRKIADALKPWVM
ncbi:MAG: GH3 auxin-responsive promoter family protein [Taibaiella sp.]|nr:GH3 auxin-responsive promoter family protein [Taibaiella sp.]